MSGMDTQKWFTPYRDKLPDEKAIPPRRVLLVTAEKVPHKFD